MHARKTVLNTMPSTRAQRKATALDKQEALKPKLGLGFGFHTWGFPAVGSAGLR